MQVLKINVFNKKLKLIGKRIYILGQSFWYVAMAVLELAL